MFFLSINQSDRIWPMMLRSRGVSSAPSSSAGQQQVEKIVVSQLEELRQCGYVIVGELGLMGVEVPGDDQVVFEQAAARANAVAPAPVQ